MENTKQDTNEWLRFVCFVGCRKSHTMFIGCTWRSESVMDVWFSLPKALKPAGLIRCVLYLEMKSTHCVVLYSVAQDTIDISRSSTSSQTPKHLVFCVVILNFAYQTVKDPCLNRNLVIFLKRNQRERFSSNPAGLWRVSRWQAPFMCAAVVWVAV